MFECSLLHYVLPVPLTELFFQHYCSKYRCCKIGYRLAVPYTILTVEKRQNEQQWNEQEYLSGE